MWAVNFGSSRGSTFAPFYQGIASVGADRDDEFAASRAGRARDARGRGRRRRSRPRRSASSPWSPLALRDSACPQLVLERMASSRLRSTALERTAATRLYAEAMADVMCLPRAQRREIACATGFIDAAAGQGQHGLDWRHTDVSRAAFLALHSHERWAGNGWPAGLPAEAIPIGSRILAVAVEWASLTAHDTARLSQADAMLALEAQSGHAFDPAVVAAAVRVVADESGFASEPSFQPKLHRLPGPRAWRRGALPGLLPGPAGS